MAENADELFFEMIDAVNEERGERTVSDPSSPNQHMTLESTFCSFELTDITQNVVTVRQIDRRWAKANVLHFLSSTEDAEPLLRINRRATEFLTGTKWIGSYGSIGMPQVHLCVDVLLRDTSSRRAVVTLTRHDALESADKNVPSCPTCMHFMVVDGHMDLGIYQRSLNLVGVMPYDLILFTNLQALVARRVGFPPGVLHWTVGSLHVLENDVNKKYGASIGGSIMLPDVEDPWKELCEL